MSWMIITTAFLRLVLHSPHIVATFVPPPMILEALAHKCSEYTSCNECIEANDPCGWCFPKNQCTLDIYCSKGSESPSLYWISYAGGLCARITKVTPSQLQSSTARTLSLNIAQMPTRSGQFWCVFRFPNRKTLKTHANLTNDGVTCYTPPTSDLPPIPALQHNFTATLSVSRMSQDGLAPVDFVSTDFVFFDCNTYMTCTSCVMSAFPCDWCINKHRCVHDISDHCRTDIIVTGLKRVGPSLRTGPDFCPKVYVANGLSEILVPYGTSKRIQVKVDNIGVWKEQQIIVATRFSCRFNIEGRVTSANAHFVEDTLYCDSISFNYNSPSSNITVPFTVVWGGGETKILDNPDNIYIIVYRCSAMAENCGICSLTDEKYGCGWCQSYNRCEVREQCDNGMGVWLNRDQICPNVEIRSFHPSSGPWEGGTNVTIEGINLGKTFDDIYSGVTVAGLPCKPYRSLYKQTRRIICELNGPGINKPKAGPIIVKVGDFRAESAKNYSFVDPIIKGINPTRGSIGGGTRLTIFGEHLSSGSRIQVFVDNVPCSILLKEPSRIECRIGRSTKKGKWDVLVKLDEGDRTYEPGFTYVDNPEIIFEREEPIRGILAGGINVTVEGNNLQVVQEPLMYVIHNGTKYIGPCNISGNDKMFCLSPTFNISSKLSDAEAKDGYLRLQYGFILDTVSYPALNFSQKNHQFLLFPNARANQLEEKIKISKVLKHKCSSEYPSFNECVKSKHPCCGWCSQQNNNTTKQMEYSECLIELQTLIDSSNGALNAKVAIQTLEILVESVAQNGNHSRSYSGDDILKTAFLAHDVILKTENNTTQYSLEKIAETTINVFGSLLTNEHQWAQWEIPGVLSLFLNALDSAATKLAEKIPAMGNTSKIFHFMKNDIQDSILVFLGASNKDNLSNINIHVKDETVPFKNSISMVIQSVISSNQLSIPYYAVTMIQPFYIENILRSTTGSFQNESDQHINILNGKLIMMSPYAKLKYRNSLNFYTRDDLIPNVTIKFAHKVRAVYNPNNAFKRKLHPGEKRKAILGNSTCVFWNNQTSKWTVEGCKLVTTDEFVTVCDCDRFGPYSVLTGVHQYLGKDLELQILTWLLFPLSIICLVLCVGSFLLRKHGKIDQTKINVHLCISLIGGIVFLLLGDKDNLHLSDEICTVFGVLTHFTWLCTFGWMAVDGIDLYIQVSQIMPATTSHLCKIYCAIAYGMPMVAVILTFTIGHSSTENSHIYVGEMFCWLQDKYIWGFGVPVIIVVLANILIIGCTLFALANRKTSKDTTVRTKNSYRKWDFQIVQQTSTETTVRIFLITFRANALSALKLTKDVYEISTRQTFRKRNAENIALNVILAIAWISGVSTLVDFQGHIVWPYAFTVLISLQGIFVFIFRCPLNKEIRRRLYIMSTEIIGRFFKTPSENYNDGIKNELNEIYILLNGKASKGKRNFEGRGRESTFEPAEYIFDDKFEIQKHSFIIDQNFVLGKGEFGEVYKGTLHGVEGSVAFKSARPSGSTVYLKALVSEVKIHMHIGHHENLISLLGVYRQEIKSGVFYVAMEFCEFGSLQSFLYKNKPLFLECPVLKSKTKISMSLDNQAKTNCNLPTNNLLFPCSMTSLLKWSGQIANAMEYLGTKNVVHSDLATRNVLLNSNGDAKVTDFGLSRQTYNYSEYIKTAKDPLPWRWLAIECLQNNTFSTKSDVWAYGITLWEIYSLGRIPYPGISPTLEFVEMLEEGLKNPQPKYASNEIYSVMMRCWNLNPDDRPSFSSMKKIFEYAVANAVDNITEKVLAEENLNDVAIQLASTDYTVI